MEAPPGQTALQSLDAYPEEHVHAPEACEQVPWPLHDAVGAGAPTRPGHVPAHALPQYPVLQVQRPVPSFPALHVPCALHVPPPGQSSEQSLLYFPAGQSLEHVKPLSPQAVPQKPALQVQPPLAHTPCPLHATVGLAGTVGQAVRQPSETYRGLHDVQFLPCQYPSVLDA